MHKIYKNLKIHRKQNFHANLVFVFLERSNLVNIVLDFGRPSISGSIRSIKMYSWAQCTMQEGLVCREMYPEEQGFGPSTLRCSEWAPTPLPIYLRYLLGAQFISNLGPEWTGSYHTKEGFQVSKGNGIGSNRELARGVKQGDWAITCVVNLYTCI
jgi:hypothetical protein